MVHRDVRWGNILAYKNKWLLTDYEHSGREWEKPTFWLDHWPQTASNGYSRKCDLYLVGKLFDEILFTLSPEAIQVKQLLIEQKLQNCEDALKCNWFNYYQK